MEGLPLHNTSSEEIQRIRDSQVESNSLNNWSNFKNSIENLSTLNERSVNPENMAKDPSRSEDLNKQESRSMIHDHQPNLAPLNTERHPHGDAPPSPETPDITNIPDFLHTEPQKTDMETKSQNSTQEKVQASASQDNSQEENLDNPNVSAQETSHQKSQMELNTPNFIANQNSNHVTIEDQLTTEHLTNSDTQQTLTKIEVDEPSETTNNSSMDSNVLSNPIENNESAHISVPTVSSNLDTLSFDQTTTTTENIQKANSHDTSTSTQVHQHALNMLFLMYPTIPKDAISALYMSTDTIVIGDKLQKTIETLNLIQSRFSDETPKEITPPSPAILNSITNSFSVFDEIVDESSTPQRTSWLQKITNPIKNKLSNWKTSSPPTDENKTTLEVSSPDEILNPEPPKQNWGVYIKEKLLAPFPPIEIVNNSERHIAVVTMGPLDFSVPIHAISTSIRAIMEGTIKIQKAEANGGSTTLRERLGPGVVISYSLVPERDGDSLSGNGWCDVGIKLTSGIYTAKYIYPQDFIITRLPLHAMNMIPYSGPYLYFLTKFMIE